MLNRWDVIGHLDAAPELKYTANGNAVATFSVATSRKYTVDGVQKEETEWARVVTWNKLAETCSQYLDKGRLVYVSGRVQTRSWDGNDGAKHYMTELIAQEVKFLGGRPEASAGAYQGADYVEPDDLPFAVDPQFTGYGEGAQRWT